MSDMADKAAHATLVEHYARLLAALDQLEAQQMTDARSKQYLGVLGRLGTSKSREAEDRAAWLRDSQRQLMPEATAAGVNEDELRRWWELVIEFDRKR